MNVKRFVLDCFACFLIPAYTLLFAGSVRGFGSSFSVLAVTGPDHYRGFIYWGVLAGGYFLVLLNALAAVLPRWAGRSVRLLAAAACLCLAYALAIPYLPDFFPRDAVLHVLLAASACVLLMAALLLVILALRRRAPSRWTGPLRAWVLTAAGCGVLFFIPRMVSTALEVFFTISAALLARRLWLLSNHDQPRERRTHGKI